MCWYSAKISLAVFALFKPTIQFKNLGRIFCFYTEFNAASPYALKKGATSASFLISCCNLPRLFALPLIYNRHFSLN